MSEHVRRCVVVHGRVQGVFFRDTCRREARDAGVSGWVRNREDGAVEACFEGDATAVESMVRWAQRGPSGAVVTNVDVRDERPEGDTRFVVRG